jgi:hypothetical protein
VIFFESFQYWHLLFIQNFFFKSCSQVYILPHSNIISSSRCNDLSSMLFPDYQKEIHLIRYMNILHDERFFILCSKKNDDDYCMLSIGESQSDDDDKWTNFFLFTINIIMFSAFFSLSIWTTRQIYRTCLFEIFIEFMLNIFCSDKREKETNKS